MPPPVVALNSSASAVQGSATNGTGALGGVGAMANVWKQTRPSTDPTNSSGSAYAQPGAAGGTPESFLGNMSGSKLASVMKGAGLMSRTAMTLPPGDDQHGVNHKFFGDVRHGIDGRFAFMEVQSDEETARTRLVRVKSVEEINAELAVQFAASRQGAFVIIEEAYEIMEKLKYIGHIESETIPMALQPRRGIPMYSDAKGKLLVSRMQGITRIPNKFGDSTKIGMYLHVVLRPTEITTPRFVFPDGKSETIPADIAEIGDTFMPLQLVYIVAESKSLGPEETEFKVNDRGIMRTKHAPSVCLGMFSAQYPKKFSVGAPRTFHQTDATHGEGNELIDFIVIAPAKA